MAEQFYGISLGYMVHVIGWPQSVKVGGSWHSGNIFLTSRKKIAVIPDCLIEVWASFNLVGSYVPYYRLQYGVHWKCLYIQHCDFAWLIFSIKAKKGGKNGVSTFFRHIFYQDCFACWDIFIFSFCWFQRSLYNTQQVWQEYNVQRRKVAW